MERIALAGVRRATSAWLVDHLEAGTRSSDA
jgi:hypothetical protein